MKFFNWTTDYQLYKQQVAKNQQKPYEEFLTHRAHEQQMSGIPPVRLAAEKKWTDEGNPYYNVHPNLVAKLCKVDLSKIPANLFRMPHGLTIANVRFAQKHSEFVIDQDQHTDLSPQISQTTGTAVAGSFVHSILLHQYKGSVLYIMDFDQYTALKQPVYSLFRIMLEDGKSMQEVIDETKYRQRDVSYQNMLENLARLTITIGFLSDNPAICEPDVLDNDKSEFSEASDTRKEFLAQRAKRRGKFGYNIGTDLMFLGERPITSKSSTAATGKELEYAHIRAGHPHAVRYGTNKSLVKIMWYSPTTVRDDLPFKQE